MSLQFILGPPGSGKTHYCLQNIESSLPESRPIFYLVPEQFSLQSEKLILGNRSATTQVQVLSFNRLAYRLFTLVGGPPGQVCDDLGKTMLLRKILLDVADDLVFYRRIAGKHGFVDSLASTITELNHYTISSEDLQLRSENMGPTLGAKLSDLALIVAKYRAAVNGHYLLADDMLDLLVHKLADANESFVALEGAYVWVDGFSGFTPQERQVLLYLMKRGVDMKITLTTREKSTDFSTGSPLFTTPRETALKLTELAVAAGITVIPPLYFGNNYRHDKNTGLAFLVQNFTTRPRRDVKPQTALGIEILAAQDRYNAVSVAAHKILSWVASGMRFRDIAIVCGDRGHYEKTLQATFDRLNIPLFVDTEIDILSHPLTELIRAALSIINHNWNYESVFRFLKTRLTGVDIETADILENFVLAHGISGYRWQYPLSGAAEDGRLHLLAALECFGTGQAKDTIRNFSHKVFQMLYALKVPETLHQWFDAHMAANDPATARIHKQIWPKICEVFDKLVEILGEEKISLDSFCSILDAGLGQVSLGRIPPTVDQVVLGDMGRSRYPQIKAMLVLGANEGLLPPIMASPGLFSEDERRLLKNTNIELAPDNLQRINDQYYALYCVLCQPSQNLCFIYAEGEPSGAVLKPSYVLRQLQQIMPKLETKKAPLLQEYGQTTGKPTQVPSSLASAAEVYGQTILTAASRLEAFARCPFAYFMNYLMQARPRQRYQVLPTDLGSLYHEVLAMFTDRLAQGHTDINTLERSTIDTLVGEIVTEINTDIFEASARNRHVLSKVHGICAASIWAMCEHIKRGEFMPLEAELDFGQGENITLENGRDLVLTGRIDRVDLLTDETGAKYVRVIDYKSGRTRFDITEVEQGLQLQLLLYMNNIQNKPDLLIKADSIKDALDSQIHPAGVYYFPVDDPIIDTDGDPTDAAIDEAILKRFRMSGVTLAGDNVLAGTDKTLAPGADSTVIPLKLNKDGRVSKTGKPLILEPEDFEKLSEIAKDKVKELGGRMSEGDIQANPYPKGIKAPCQYCEFGAICTRQSR